MPPDLKHQVEGNNETRGATNDKAWKFGKVVQVLQRTFLSSWTVGARFSFDEGVLPSTSRMKGTRMHMPDKPHKWGTKMFMCCDADTSYCYRYAVARVFRLSSDLVLYKMRSKFADDLVRHLVCIL